MRQGGGSDLKLCGRIQGIVKTVGSGINSSGRGIRRHSSSPKPTSAKSEIQKPSSIDSSKEGWIYVRGCRIKRSPAMCFDSQGEVYVPDSEDDESGADLAPAVAANGAAGADLAPAVTAEGAAGVQLAPTVPADGTAGVDVAPVVTADGAAGVEMSPEVAARIAKKVLGEDLHPEVAVRLAEVLSRIEPFCHEWFIGVYKVMVPLFFTPAP
jgi:hypothetical protein